MKVNKTDIARVIEACFKMGARQAIIFRAPNMVVRASRQFKIRKDDVHTTLVLTIGRPNFLERKFIKACQKAGEPFPVRKIQLKWYK